MSTEAKYSSSGTERLAHSYVPLGNFKDILEHPPFNGVSNGTSTGTPIHVLCDLDGVISHPFKRGSLRQGLPTLQSVASQANALTIWTARMIPNADGVVWRRGLQKIFDSQRSRERGGISRFPFLSDASVEALTTMVYETNPTCEVDFLGGDNKFRTRSNFVPLAHDILEQGRHLVIVGSSLFERKGVDQLIKQLEETGNSHLMLRINYFDTQGLVI